MLVYNVKVGILVLKEMSFVDQLLTPTWTSASIRAREMSFSTSAICSSLTDTPDDKRVIDERKLCPNSAKTMLIGKNVEKR